MFVLAERISETIYPECKFSDFGRLFKEDRAFMNYYESNHGIRNYHSLDRKYPLEQLMNLLISTDVGDTAKCGVY